MCLWCGGHVTCWRPQWAKDVAVSNRRAVVKPSGPQSTQVLGTEWVQTMVLWIDGRHGLPCWLLPWLDHDNHGKTFSPSVLLCECLECLGHFSLAKIALMKPFLSPLTLHTQNPTSQSSENLISISFQKKKTNPHQSTWPELLRKIEHGPGTGEAKYAICELLGFGGDAQGSLWHT